MDYEKKYKELEGKIKKAYLYAQTDSTKAVLEDILPELAESEDEKIRKDIIRVFTGEIPYTSKEENEKYISWLEKQGKKTQCKSALEAIKEKPANNANKVEPKFKVKYAGNEYNVLETKEFPGGITYYGIEDEPNHIDYVLPENCEIISGYGEKEKGNLYPTKSATFSEQTSAWNEEDEKNLKRAIWYVEHSAINVVKDTMLSEWLKSIKERVQPQPKQEWSEEDEKIALSIEQVMNCASLLNLVPEKIEKVRAWLKSLKERIGA